MLQKTNPYDLPSNVPPPNTPAGASVYESVCPRLGVILGIAPLAAAFVFVVWMLRVLAVLRYCRQQNLSELRASRAPYESRT